jgi:hypothetical protein
MCYTHNIKGETMIELEFVRELYELCQKHKRNVSISVDARIGEEKCYQIYINGEWEVWDDTPAVEVYEVGENTEVYTINGNLASKTLPSKLSKLSKLDK